MRRWDVSMPLSSRTPAFPGDPGFASSAVKRLARGDPYNLSQVAFGTHAGTHVDPPAHFVTDGATIDRIDLDRLNGPCTVWRVPDSVGRIGQEALRGVPPGTERLLLRTSNSARWSARLEFFPDYAALDVTGARLLRELGVRSVGIDSLSIENDPSGTFPVHRELLGHGVLIVEGLLLDGIEPGPYALDCLPLRLEAGDGGPARAVLRSM